jgi:hypothetical protein
MSSATPIYTPCNYYSDCKNYGLCSNCRKSFENIPYNVIMKPTKDYYQKAKKTKIV